MINKNIAIIGAGKMGTALIKGLLSARVIFQKNIIASDKDKSRLKAIAKSKVRTTVYNSIAVGWGDVIVISVKPKDIDIVLKEVAEVHLKNKLFISIAAGINTSFIEDKLGNVPVVRAMPNTPALVGEGMTAISLGRFARGMDSRIARAIFKSIGEVIEVPERYMDAVTALSGSGPAYFFFLMEILIEAGRKFGLSSRDILSLTIQTALGAARLARESNIHPVKLREMVTSPGGTTEAAFKVLKQDRVKDSILRAIVAAKKRSRELRK